MKNLYNFLYSAALLSCFNSLSMAQCVPNNDTISGIEPDSLAIAYVDVPYEEVIYFRLPADTLAPIVIGGDTIYLQLCIDSLTIDSVHGLPDNFSFACNVPWCSVKGGGNGCAAITGTATGSQIGIYPLDVFVTIYTNDCSTFALPPQNDTVSFYFLNIMAGGVGITPLPAVKKPGISSVYPNPSSDELSVEFDLQDQSMVQVSVMNFYGEELYRNEAILKTGRNSAKLDVSALPAGIYFLQIVQNGSVAHTRFEVVHE